VGYEFLERPDGYKGLVAAYGLRFKGAPRVMDLGLLYRALQEKQVDIVAGNSTDGLIAALGCVVLKDDKNYFPAYEAVPLVRQDALARFPDLDAALAELAGKISENEMRRLNYAIDGEHRDVKAVASEFLNNKGL
jgi:osmoprotectant transport system substrate-binding protein